MRFYFSLLLGLGLLAVAPAVVAQTGPDTLRTKEELPSRLPEGQDGRELPPRTAPAPNPSPSQRVPPPVPSADQAEVKRTMYTGGNVGLNLFGPYFFFDISPILGYKITRWFSVGPGVVYQYTRQNQIGYSNFGLKGFARIQVLPVLFLHGEHEVLWVPTWKQSAGGALTIDGRANLQTTLVGAGYRQRVSDRAAMDTMLLLNVSADKNLSPYSNPVLRVGFYYEF